MKNIKNKQVEYWYNRRILQSSSISIINNKILKHFGLFTVKMEN